MVIRWLSEKRSLTMVCIVIVLLPVKGGPGKKLPRWERNIYGQIYITAWWSKRTARHRTSLHRRFPTILCFFVGALELLSHSVHNQWEETGGGKKAVEVKASHQEPTISSHQRPSQECIRPRTSWPPHPTTQMRCKYCRRCTKTKAKCCI